MPKISNNQCRICTNIIDRGFNVEIFYNQFHAFYHELPDEFLEICKHLSYEECESLSIEKKRESKYKVNDKKYIVSAEKEGDCLSKSQRAIRELLGKAVSKRNVIIVFYNPLRVTNYNSHEYNNEHPQIGMQFGLTYAEEASIAEQKSYYIYSEYDGFGGQKHKSKKEIRLWNESATIIPDTEQNRTVLEALYNNMKALNEKMAEFTSTEDKMLEMISAGKMLNA